MPLVLKDRVKELTTSTGTGAVTLAGAVTGYQSFAAIGDGNTTYYVISGGSEWEVGIGTYTASGTTLSRGTVLASSNAGALVNFSAGTKDVICSYPADKAVYEDENGLVTLGDASPTITYSGLPAAGLQVSIDPTTNSYNTVFQTSVDSTLSAAIGLAKSRGTTTSPSAVQSGDSLAFIGVFAYDGVNYVPAGAITFALDGTPGVNDMPSAIRFYTTGDGTAVNSERMQINSAGNVGINASPGNIRLYALGNSGQNAIYGNTSGTAYGVQGQSSGYYGMYGKTTSASHGGVLGYDSSGTKYGIIGHAAVYSFYGAGTFYNAGNGQVTGSFSKGSGTFLIDHPLDPLNKNLYHGFVEAPRYDLIYRGKVQLQNGTANVDIDFESDMTDGTFDALCQNQEVTSLCNLTGFARLKPTPIVNGKFTIQCEDPTSTDTVTWVVMGERKDAFIKSIDNVDVEGRLIPEWEKPNG